MIYKVDGFYYKLIKPELLKVNDYAVDPTCFHSENHIFRIEEKNWNDNDWGYLKVIETNNPKFKDIFMNKKEKTIKIKYYFDWTYGVEIKQIREDLYNLEKLGATHIYLDYGLCYDDAYLNIDAYYTRLETDEEYEMRMRETKAKEDLEKQRELNLLENLKKKYEQ